MAQRPSIRQLEYLVALSETLNFRRAAEACFVSQPALSAQIRLLEEQLGVRLFERDRRRVLATAAGLDMVRKAREVLRATDELLELSRGHGAPLTGTLRLGVIPTVAPYLLPPAVRALRASHPELRLLLREERTPLLVECLREGSLDLLLLAMEADLGAAETMALFVDPFMLALPQTHALATKSGVQEADLAGETVLLLEDGHCLRDQALGICESSGAAENDDFRASSLNTLVRMVSSGIGITLLPGMAVEAEVHAGDDLTVKPFESKGYHRTIGLAWRRGSPRRAEYLLLAEELQACAPSELRRLPLVQ